MKFTILGDWKKHTSNHTEETSFEFDKCATLGSLNIHKRTHSFQYDQYEYTFSDPSNLIKRIKRIHTGYKPFECDKCEYKSSRSGSLTIHKRIHSQEKPFECNLCEYKCSTSGYLIVHKRIHTGEKPFQCDKCEKKFTQSGSLKVHKRIHTGLKPFQCDQCQYKCNQSGSLKIHKRNHSKAICEHKQKKI